MTDKPPLRIVKTPSVHRGVAPTMPRRQCWLCDRSSSVFRAHYGDYVPMCEKHMVDLLACRTGDGPMNDHAAILRRLDGVPYHVEIEPVPSLFERICGWLGDTFGESPRGFAFFAATLAPLAVAAFLVGYFGLRELLAVFS